MKWTTVVINTYFNLSTFPYKDIKLFNIMQSVLKISYTIRMFNGTNFTSNMLRIFFTAEKKTFCNFTNLSQS
jgi:hypothetical protein